MAKFLGLTYSFREIIGLSGFVLIVTKCIPGVQHTKPIFANVHSIRQLLHCGFGGARVVAGKRRVRVFVLFHTASSEHLQTRHIS